MEDEVSIIDLIKVLSRYKILIFLLVVVSTLAAAVFTLSRPPLYKATATILPLEASGGSVMSALSEISFLSVGGVGAMGSGARLMAVLKSRTLAESVNEELCLHKLLNQEKQGKKRETEFGPFQATVMLLQRRVETKTTKDGLLSITAVFNDPDVSAKIANTYVKKLGEYLIKHPLNASFQSMDPAVPPREPFNIIKWKQNVLLAGLASLFLGITLVFVFKYVKNVRELMRQT